MRLSQVGDVKFGDFKGEDTAGNKYYENLDYPYGEKSEPASELAPLRGLTYQDIGGSCSSCIPCLLMSDFSLLIPSAVCAVA